MPRQSRIDYPGALHHIMVRGIERRDIFTDTRDRKTFLERLGNNFLKSNTQCFAFSLMSNHFHLLLQTGERPISKVMQSLLTGYAMYFNWKHQRTGKLYQNRFKSILCNKESYLLELVRYIHLNPLRVGLVENLSKLDKYTWTGHSILMGNKESEWLNSDEILSNFGRTLRKAREEYREFVKAGIDQGNPEDLSGGGLIRSLGGVWETIKLAKKGKKHAADERILGVGDFVDRVFDLTEEQESKRSRLKREGWNFDKILHYAARTVEVEPEELLRRGRSNARSAGRILLCKWMVDELGESQVRVAEYLGISRSAVGQLIEKGRRMEKEMGIEFP